MITIYEKIPFDEERNQYDFYGMWTSPAVYNRNSQLYMYDWQDGVLGRSANDPHKRGMKMLIDKMSAGLKQIDADNPTVRVYENFWMLGPFGKLFVLQGSYATDYLRHEAMILSMMEMEKQIGDKNIALSWPRDIAKSFPALEWLKSSYKGNISVFVGENLMDKSLAQQEWAKVCAAIGLNPAECPIEPVFKGWSPTVAGVKYQLRVMESYWTKERYKNEEKN